MRVRSETQSSNFNESENIDLPHFLAMALQTPILFLIFNRPEQTQRVFETIRKQQPKQLFIAADGPRSNVHTDEKKCLEAQSFIGKIDWDCRLRFHVPPSIILLGAMRKTEKLNFELSIQHEIRQNF